MKKLISGLMLASFLVSAPLAYVSAEDSTSTINLLLQQIEILKAQIETIQQQITVLQAAKGEIKEVKEEVKSTLQLIKSLSRGMTGEEVTLLQEILATDPDIYPEGLVTGYFGPLTERAVKKFQQKAGIENVGVVGPKTKAKINELLTEGAGQSGKVPPGLLIAPGIRKKLGYTPEPPAGQVLPPGIAKKIGATTTPGEEDTTPPVISGVVSTSTSANSSIIKWTTDEESTSKVYYGTSTPLDTSAASYVESAALVLSHEITLSGLTASTTYYFVVSSSDNDANVATSSEYSFTTSEEVVEDTTPPVISGVISTSTLATSSIIKWTTDEESTSKVYYGTSTPLDTSAASYVESAALVLSHEITLSGLTASTTYYFVVSSADASSNVSTSSENSFTTQ